MTGAAGVTGARGVTGATGTGATGARGVTGEQGPSGTLVTSEWNGYVGGSQGAAIATSTTSTDQGPYVFVGQTTTVTVPSAADVVTGSGSAVLGVSTGTATFDIAICEQAGSAGTITPLDGNSSSNETVDATTTSIPYALSAAGAVGAAGTYTVGMCVTDIVDSTALRSRDRSRRPPPSSTRTTGRSAMRR